jgi:hypothetical protein
MRRGVVFPVEVSGSGRPAVTSPLSPGYWMARLSTSSMWRTPVRARRELCDGPSGRLRGFPSGLCPVTYTSGGPSRAGRDPPHAERARSLSPLGTSTVGMRNSAAPCSFFL